MQIRFYKDAESGLAHCYHEHGVSEREVIDVLSRPGDKLRRRDGTRVAEGQTDAGRYIRVIYREYRERDYIFVITAYDLHGKAKQAYRRRRRP
jgi:hypothetical protein